jgi:hypothetical protein
MQYSCVHLGQAWSSKWDYQGVYGSGHSPQLYGGNANTVLYMQADGNCVMFNDSGGTNDPIWATHTEGNDDAYLRVQDDGNVVVYTALNAPLWSIF